MATVGRTSRASTVPGGGASDRVERNAPDLSRLDNEAYVQTMITLVRLGRILCSSSRQPSRSRSSSGSGGQRSERPRKIVLLALVAGCVVLAAKVSTLAGKAQEF